MPDGSTKSGLIGTRSGVYDLFNFKAEYVNKGDIFHVLSHMCRYGGRCNRFFSVAQHSILVSQILRDSIGSPHDGAGIVLGGLCHDFSEAYLTDIIRPIKMMIPDIEEIEQSIMDAISSVIPTGYHDCPAVKEADNIALYHEANHLGFNTKDWGFSDRIKKSNLSGRSLVKLRSHRDFGYWTDSLSLAHDYYSRKSEGKDNAK